jgi:hypothetical protein
MAQPAISGSPQEILVSAAALLVDGVNVGLVSGVKLTIKELTTDVMTDQAGKSIVNTFYVGNEMSGECEFDQFTAVKMGLAFPQADLIVSGPTSRLAFGKPIGADYYSIAKEFVFIPTSDDVNYFGRQFKWWKGVFVGEASIDYGPDKKLTFKSKMKFYPDFTKPAGQFFGYMGDPAAGTFTPASAAAAVAGGGNVGNGTVSGVSVNNTFTKTETWTLACIATAVNGGLFTVTGSSFASNSAIPANSEIILTINDGATDFAIGDSFTIATTAANYT